MRADHTHSDCTALLSSNFLGKQKVLAQMLASRRT